MTTTERATNLIQRIERLFERATKGPWVLDASYPGCIYSEDSTGSIIARTTGFDYAPCPQAEMMGNAFLIVTVRNVGLEAVVGPIRKALKRALECAYCDGSGKNSRTTRGGICRNCEFPLELLVEACDRWEPELDREEGRK